jgi:hypothetical protein
MSLTAQRASGLMRLMATIFNKKCSYSIYDENDFYAIFEQDGTYFLFDKETRKSVIIVECDGLQDAIDKYADQLEAPKSEGKGPIKSKDQAS